MLGYCGVNCDACRARRGTVTGDPSALEYAAAHFGNGGFSASEWACLGCQPADQPFLAEFCARCKIRTCAISKGLSNCAACAGMEACTQLHTFIQEEGEEVVRTMQLLRRRFLDRQRQA